MKVAIPHTDPEHVKKPVISIARMNKPVTFHEMGQHNQTVEVELIFTLALNDKQNHLETIQQLIGLFSESETMIKLKQASTEKELMDIICQAISVYQD